jgi:aminobenzoyl-glutamate utilization protein B
VDINIASSVNLTRKHFNQRSRISHVIREGGGEPNCPPEWAQIWYYLRAGNMDELKRMHEEVVKCAEAAAHASGTDFEEKIQSGCYNFLRNKVLANLIYDNMKLIGAPKFTDEEKEFARKMQEPLLDRHVKFDFALDEDIHIEKEEGAYSQDDGDCSWKTPYVYFGTAARVNGIMGHTWEWTAVSGTSIGQKGMMFAAKTMAASVIDVLTKPEILKSAREEFEEATKDFVYECFVPPDVKPPDADFFRVEMAKMPE